MLICDDDELELGALKRTAADAGFEIVDTARHAIELLQLVQVHQPEAAIVRNEINGVSGLEVTEDLSRLEPPVEVILVTTDVSLEPLGLAAGAFAVVLRRDTEMLETALGALGERLAGGERRKGTDRRAGMDRRQLQDWAQVYSERRAGEDRRKELRRDADRNPQPPDAG